MADRDALDTATRIAAGDDQTNYDNVAIALHWLTALLVVTQFALAETWDWFSRGTRDAMESTHVSFGILLTVVVVARLIWRWMPGHQRASLESGLVKIASKAVHYLLYALLVVQAGLGWTIGWAAGKPIHFFGIAIPGPFEAFARPVRHDIREIHSWVGWAIIILALGHALAALYHHYKLHDRVLGRMLPLARKSERPA
jgi:cytochrome b561